MRILLFALLSGLIPGAVAQEADNEETAPVDDNTTTLETILVTAPPLETVDLYKFRNPVDAQPTVFGRGWREKPSLEEVGMNGGVVPIIAGYAALKVRDGARRIPGWKNPEQPAMARPPPLTEAQIERASRLQEGTP
jgi:hypothetical protein